MKAIKKKNKLKKQAWELAGFIAFLVSLEDETIQYHRREICI